MLDLATTLSLTMKIVGFATVVSSLELLALWRAREFASDGIWDWSIIGTATSPRSGLVDPLFRHQKALPVILALRVAAGLACLLLWWNPLVTGLLLGLLFLIQMLLNTRIVFGDDGSDQMLSIVLASLVVASLASTNETAVTICLIFLAMQGTLSYSCSGIAKCFGEHWRDGSALPRVLGHYAYGHQAFHNALSRFSPVGRIASWSVMGFQLLFVFYWITPEPWHLMWLASSLLFHAGIAYFMRLNGFLFSFPACYPALIYVHHLL